MTLCVSPPVAGVPVPNVPVNVMVYVLGNPIFVPTVIVAVEVPPAVRFTDAGPEHEYPDVLG